MCAARYSDAIFAKDHLLDYCRRERLAHVPFTRLDEVVAALR